jgi:hypothetical protein
MTIRSPRRDEVLPVSLGGRSLLDLPVGAFEVLHDCVGDLVLFVLSAAA